MGASVTAQAIFLLLAAVLGALLGLLYDLLRPLRRRMGDAVWDLLYCAASAAACFCFAMGAPDGRLGSGGIMAALAGLCLYLHTLSPQLSPLIERIARRIGNVWIIPLCFEKNIQKMQKNSLKKPTNEI